ncbi:MAG: Hsp20/alpha crystallin family protein [Propylenella sp.]
MLKTLKTNVPVTRERGLFPTFPGFPLGSLQREMDRLFADFSRGFGTPATPWSSELMPRMNIGETEGEIEFTAELPGIEEKDVEVTLADDVLTIRGEKKAEKEEKEKDYRLVERSFGSFSRSFQVPAGVDPARIRATIEKGVLTVKFPKPAQVEAKRIDVKAAA